MTGTAAFRRTARGGLLTWPGVHPRISAPLTLAFYAFYAWFLSGNGRRHHAVWSWPVLGLVLVTFLFSTAREWRSRVQVADALAGRVDPVPEVADEVDAVARRVDDTGRLQTWAALVAIVVLGAFAVLLAIRGDVWTIVAPAAGLAVVSAVSLAVLRLRKQRVERWLERRPRQPGWESVPP